MANKFNLPKNITRQRNLLHNHPLLSKGGIHRKSNKSRRRLDKVKMKKEWLPLNILLPMCVPVRVPVYLAEAIDNYLYSIQIKRAVNRKQALS